MPKAVPRRADITVSLADSAPAWMELDDALERQELDKIELIGDFGRGASQREKKQEKMDETIRRSGEDSFSLWNNKKT